MSEEVSLGVFIWEGNSGTAEPSDALLHQFSLVIVEEKSPNTELPASSEGSGGTEVYVPVPEIPSNVFVSSHSNVIYLIYINK